jgi:hypothetical protein
MRVARQMALLLMFVGASCKGTTSTAADGCLVAYQSLFVTATDSVSGALVPNALLKAVGPVTDSIAIGSNTNLYPVPLAPVAGTYVVTIQATGYSTWTRSETVTSSDPTECHRPDGLSVTAQLHKLP